MLSLLKHCHGVADSPKENLRLSQMHNAKLAYALSWRSRFTEGNSSFLIPNLSEATPHPHGLNFSAKRFFSVSNMQLTFFFFKTKQH